MENFKIVSTVRHESGKGNSRKLRSKGRLPAILYGHKEKPVELVIGETDVRQILHAHPESPIVDLDIEGGKSGINTVIRDVQRHPATGRLLHVDFQRIRLDEKVRIEVPIEITGNPVGVKDQGGILEHGTRSVSVICLPTNIPRAIELEVSDLQIHDSIKLKDIIASYADVEFLDDMETPLATVIPPVVEKVAVEAEEGEEPGAEPAVEPEEAEKKEGEESAE